MSKNQTQGLPDPDRVTDGWIYGYGRRETEQAVLSAAAYRGKLHETATGLTAGMFLYPDTRAVFKALAALDAEGLDRADLTLVRDKLHELGLPSVALGDIISALNIDVYCYAEHVQALRAHCANQQAVLALQECAEKLADGRDIFDVADDLVSKAGELREIGETTAPPDYTFLDAVLDAEAEAANPSARVATTFGALDEALGGGLGAGLFVVGAAPATGKSALALQLALSALAQGRVVAYFSLEMNGAETGRRILAATADALGEEARERLRRAHYSTAAGLPQITSGIDRHLRGKGPGMAVVDYLQLTDRPDARVPETQFLGQVTRRLKLLSQELDIPVVLLSQLNRNSRTEGRAPTPADLRGSGCIEQDANQVLLMWRDAEGEEAVGPNGERAVHFRLSKNRSGGLCSFDAVFDPSHMRFIEVSRRVADEYAAKGA